jgi:hypothetical protein
MLGNGLFRFVSRNNLGTSLLHPIGILVLALGRMVAY